MPTVVCCAAYCAVDVQRAVEKGANIVREPWSETDEFGTVRFATIRTFGDVTHTFVDRSQYSAGWFLPGYQQRASSDPVTAALLVSATVAIMS